MAYVTKVPHRTPRSIAVDKGTTPAGFSGAPASPVTDPAVLTAGQAQLALGYADNTASARERMDSVGEPVTTQPAPFSLGAGGKR